MPTTAFPQNAPLRKRRPIRRFSLDDRARLLRRYERSGQSAHRFCREHDLSTSLLWYWLAREREAVETARGVGALVEVPSAALSVAVAAVAGAVTLQITGGTRLEVSVGTDPAWIGALVRALAPARE